MMKRVILLLVPAMAFGATEPVTVNSLNGKIRKTAAGVGDVSKPYDFTDVFVSSLTGLIPPGGTTGQILAKSSNANYATHWITNSGGGGGGGACANVTDYGAVADLVTLYDITLIGTPPSNRIHSASTTFTNGDIGKWMVIRSAFGAPDGVSPVHVVIESITGGDAIVSQTMTIILYDPPVDIPRCDYGTDNVDAFMAAVASLPAAGGKVYVPRGNYFIGASTGAHGFRINRSNVVLQGDGRGITNLFYSSAMCAIDGAYQAGTGISIGLEPQAQYFNIKLADFSLYDLAKYGLGCSNGINVWGVTNLRIERLELFNCKGNGALNVQGASVGTGDYSDHLYINDCYVHGDFDGGGINGDGVNVGNMRDVHFTNNYIYNVGRQGYEGGGNCYDQIFAFNTIDMNNAGISGLNPTGGNQTIVSNNNIYNVGAADNAAGAAVDFTTDIGAPFTANDIIVTGNRLHGRSQSLIRFQNTSGDETVNHLNNLTVSNNWCKGTGTNSAGVFFGPGFPDTLITGNRFDVTSNVINYLTGWGSPADADARLIFTNNNCIGAGGILENVSMTPPLSNKIIIEDNDVDPGIQDNRYGGSGQSQLNTTISAGASASAAGAFGGAVPGIHEVVFIQTVATINAGVILWGVVTDVNEVTTYGYNPTAGNLSVAQPRFYLRRARMR